MSRTLGKMFDPEDRRMRLQDGHEFTDDLDHLRKVEEFFCETIKLHPSEGAFDCSAPQPFPFWTINYTSFSGFFMMNPMQNELRAFQIQDAIYDNREDAVCYMGYFYDRIRGGRANKYKDRKPVGNLSELGGALVVLPGENVLDKAVNIQTLRWIVEEYGKFASIKPHPLTSQSVIDDLKSQLLPVARFLDADVDIYEIMPRVDIVYTTHHSETAINAVSLSKKIAPISDYRYRMSGAFAHINEPLFYSLEPSKLIQRMFSSYKSGIIHPDLQPDWQDRIVRYLNYIHALRSHMKNASK